MKTGYSAGEKPSTNKAETAKGTEINSRYYPIKSYAACDNDPPWAWYLDKPCVVDNDEPTKAFCVYTVKRNQGPHLVVANTYTDTTCATNLWSSATVAGVNQITDFPKTAKVLEPYDIKVLNSPN